MRNNVFLLIITYFSMLFTFFPDYPRFRYYVGLALTIFILLTIIVNLLIVAYRIVWTFKSVISFCMQDEAAFDRMLNQKIPDKLKKT